MVNEELRIKLFFDLCQNVLGVLLGKSRPYNRVPFSVITLALGKSDKITVFCLYDATTVNCNTVDCHVKSNTAVVELVNSVDREAVNLKLL